MKFESRGNRTVRKFPLEKKQRGSVWSLGAMISLSLLLPRWKPANAQTSLRARERESERDGDVAIHGGVVWSDWRWRVGGNPSSHLLGLPRHRELCRWRLLHRRSSPDPLVRYRFYFFSLWSLNCCFLFCLLILVFLGEDVILWCFWEVTGMRVFLSMIFFFLGFGCCFVVLSCLFWFCACGCDVVLFWDVIIVLVFFDCFVDVWWFFFRFSC